MKRLYSYLLGILLSGIAVAGETVRIHAIPKGGTVVATDGKLIIKGADEVTFLLTADTNKSLLKHIKGRNIK